ncbi:MAG: DUF2378 family protein [Myxococcota bacterium]
MDTVEPVIFGAAIEGIRRAFAKQLTPELVAQLASGGVKLEHPQVAYPADTWVFVVRTVGDALASEVPERERYVHIGRLFMRGFVQTGVGFAALTAGKVMGVRRTLLRMGRNFRTAANYIETEFTEVGPKELLIRTWVREPFLSKIKDRSTLILEYRQGVLQEVMELVGGQGQVELLAADAARHDGRYRATWA